MGTYGNSVRGNLWELMGTYGNLWELRACFLHCKAFFSMRFFSLQGVFFTAFFRCKAFFTAKIIRNNIRNNNSLNSKVIVLLSAVMRFESGFLQK